MKRIGIVLGSSPGGGVFQYAQAMLDAVLRFPRDEFELYAAYSDSVWLSYIPSGRMKVIRLDHSPRSRALNRLRHSSRLSNAAWRKIAPTVDPDVAALVRTRCDLWVCPSNDRWAFRAPIPALGTIHDLMHIHEPGFPEVGSPAELRERDQHFAETCRWSKGVAVDSELGRGQLCDAYDVPPDRVFVLPYIAPKYIYDSAALDARHLNYELPSRYLFYPANFWLHKNHAGLFAAIDRLRSRYPDIHLVLVGARQNGYAAAREGVASLGIESHVTFLGYVPDEEMFELYRRARALVMPSFFGPTNIPQLEAFVAGCPVAASGVYGVPAQVGDAALLFDPASVDEIAACIERLWTNDALCESLAEKGRRKAREWGPAQFSDRLLQIVEALTGSPAASATR